MRHLIAPALLLLGACASGGPPAGPAAPGVPEGPAVEYRGVPGFDTRDYPGDGVMARWREHSPYRWVGYYLPAPCYTGTSWVGKRGVLEDLEWGLAVLYVGEQDWRAMGTPPEMTDSAAAANPRCASANLTRGNGQAHARDAAAQAEAEGFPPGTVIYLDVERVDEVSPELEAYVGGWIDGLLEDARYLAGLYAHQRNATALMDVARAAYQERARLGGPRLWVASSEGFDVTAHPSESGFTGATIWQGAFDRRERWGDVTLRIDVNVAEAGLY
ncbi:MAG TPA: glycoside hydrolase domain-containing protein [Longimicrobiales bacterium]|nr:glycoside hydrolase domain-containing protein [Longimicrobiales bacterium]